MNFDLGYLVVLGVVVVILIIFRQMDKNNRSLDKVRKYAETVKADLNTFVEERTTRISDFETELKVHDKTAAEVLKRIKAVEENLLTRLPEIEALQTRLDAYGASLTGLHDMSAKVDENLGRLKEESEFVDKVGRRIKQANEQMTALEAQLPAFRDEIRAASQADLEAAKAAALEAFDHETKSYTVRLAEANAKVDNFTKFIQSLEDRKAAFLAETQKALAESLTKGMTKAEESMKGWDKDLLARLSNHEKSLDAAEKDFQKRMAAAAASAAKLETEVFGELESKITAAAAGVEKKAATEIKAAEDRIKAGLASLGDKVNGQVTDLSHLLDSARGDFDSFRTDLDTDMAALRDRLDGFAGLADQKIKTGQAEVAKDLQAAQAQMLALVAQLKADLEVKLVQTGNDIVAKGVEAGTAMDDKLRDFETNFTYRLQKVEEVEKDIQSLDQNLRQSMERVALRIQDDFKAFDARMTERRVEEQTLLDTRSQATRDQMDALERGLEELKSRAYDNVSTKLQVFEEDFFLDLQKRGASIQQSFEDWQKSIQLKLEDLENMARRERLDLERAYTDQLKSQLVELQTGTNQNLEKIETQLLEQQSALGAQIKIYQEQLESAGQKLREDIAEMERSSLLRFEQELGRHEIETNEILTKLDREVEAKVRQISDKVDMNRGEVQAALDSAASEFTIFQTRNSQKFKEIEGEVEDQYRAFKNFVTERITTLTSEFNSQKDDLVMSTNEERLALRNELSTLRQGLQNLEGELRSKTESALDQFRKDYEGFNLEYQRRTRDLQGDLELKLKDFRNSIEDTQGKGEALQKKLFGKIEDQYNLLSVNIEEIDRKQKAFLAQTKLFERADTLKTELTEQLEDLKTDMAKLDLQKKELFEIENQIVRVKKMGEDIGTKFAGFLAEKKRIDSLDADFQKILGLSQAMELRLEQVTNSHDSLQDIQFKIRKLEDYQKDVETRYERLEKRRDILDQTSEGVDRNYALLEKMERSLKTVSTDLATLPNEVEELKKRMKALTAGRDEVDSAVAKLTNLDQILRDIETRISRMEEARDWLARTETRLQEAGKEAEEHVRLLGSLAKAGSPTAARGKGAPATEMRQTVIKLANQGWSKEEIARSTRLSLGEVELILELGPR